MPGDGVLMFVVPHYALAASARFLACQYTDFRAWRFPDEDQAKAALEAEAQAAADALNR
jgi:hypothetical protein